MPPNEDRIASRINIRYTPATGDAKEEKELPFAALILGDFSGGNNPAEFSARKALDIHKHNFEERLAAQNLSMDLSVPDRLSAEEGARMQVHLDIRGMKDFSPDAIVQQVDRLKQLVELRGLLESLKEQFMNEKEFAAALRGILKDPETTQAILQELKIRTQQG